MGLGRFAGHGHGGASSDDAAAAADMMEQGCVRLRPQPVKFVTGERAAEERRGPKKLSPSGHSPQPTMKFARVFFPCLLIGLLLMYFLTATSLPMSNAMRISFLFVASAPLVITLVANVLLHRDD